MPTFRLATAADIPALVVLINTAYRGDSSRAGWTTEADLLAGQRTDPQTMADILAAPGQSVLLAEDDGVLVGSVHLVQEPEQTLYFGMLTVRPTAQGAGVGRLLLEEIARRALALGAVRLRMTVIHLRPELMAWYERRGFVRTGRELAFPMDDPKYGLPLVPLLVLWEFERRLS